MPPHHLVSSQDWAAKPPDPLTEIAELLTPDRTERTCPRAVKRARHNNYRVKKPGEPASIRHTRAATIMTHSLNPRAARSTYATRHCGQADLLAHPFRLSLGVEPEDAGTPAVRCEERGEDVDRRRLACAVGSEECEDLSAPHLEVDTFQDLGVLEGLRQVLSLDGDVGHCFFSSSPSLSITLRFSSSCHFSVSVLA